MQIVAVNASPRKNKNTATILQHVLDGAKAAAGPETQTELIHLYDFKFTGCRSCFQCKRLGGKYYGKCAVKDDIAPVLEKLAQADAMVFGSPIYFSEVTGILRMLEERLLFPYFVYAEGWPSLAPKIRTGFVYTMNLPEQTMKEWGYPELLGKMEGVVGNIFGCPPETLYVCDTVQFDDYSKYKCEIFSGEEKIRWREEHFPEDCRKAREMGARLVRAA